MSCKIQHRSEWGNRRMNATEGVAIQQHSITGLCMIGELCLRRHRALRAEAPLQPTAAYLRQGIACARAIARLATINPDWLTQAYVLLEAVITAAQQAEEETANAGRNSTPYLTVWIAAESLVLQLQHRESLTQAAAQNVPSNEAPMPPAPAPSDPPDLIAIRQSVRQGGMPVHPQLAPFAPRPLPYANQAKRH